MKIQFCDLCNESVPQADLEQGRAFIRKDRVICATCEGVMSHAEVSAPAPSRFASDMRATSNATVSPAQESVPSAVPSPVPPATHGHVSHLQPIVVRTAGGGALWVALLGLVFTGGAVFVLDDRIHSLQERGNELQKTVDARTGDIQMLQRGQAFANDAQREFERKSDVRFDTQKTRNDTLVEDVARLRQERDELSTRIAAVTLKVADQELRSGSGGLELEKRLADLSARLARSEDDLRSTTAKMLALEALASAPPAPVPDSAGPAKPDEPAWKAQVKDLASDNNSVRWEAVTALGASHDLETVPHLAPMLKDVDVFVRMAAARVLGEMQAKTAVSALIDALEDNETAVREQAYVALRTITGKDLKFDPLEKVEAERAKRVKAWREWWKKESETPSGT